MDFELQIAAAEFAQAVLPDDEVQQQQANRQAIARDGRIQRQAIQNAIPWQRVSWYLATPTTGSNVDAEFPMPQGARISQVVIRAKTPAGGGPFQIQIDKGSGSPIAAGLQAGMSSVSISTNDRCDPGSVLRLNVLSVNGAAGVTVTVFYGG